MSIEINPSAVEQQHEVLFMGGVVLGSPENTQPTLWLSEEAARAVESFIDDLLEPRSRNEFVQRLREDQVLRLATISRRQQKLAAADESFTDLNMSIAMEQFRSFGLLFPGSTYVLGEEFTQSTIGQRNQYIERACKALERVFEQGEFEDLALENAWRLGYNQQVLSEAIPAMPRPNSPFGGFFHAVAAVREHERGSWADRGTGFIEPIHC